MLSSTSNPKSPLVTVLLSSHNGEKYLRQALESMAVQTFTDWEWVLVNDGSTDQTLGIFEEYRIRFCDRIKIIHHKQKRGLTESLNEGLAQSTGKYVARMDDDDVSHPERLACQVKAMEADRSLVLLGTAGYRIEERTGQVGDYMPHYDPIRLRLVLCWLNPFLHSSVMYRAGILRERRLQYPVEYPAAEDYGLWAMLASVGKLAVLDDRLITYRSRASSVTGQRRTLQLESSGQVSSWYTRTFFGDGPFADTSPDEVRILIEEAEFPTAQRVARVKSLFEWAGQKPPYARRVVQDSFMKWATPFLDRYKIPSLIRPRPLCLLSACSVSALRYVAQRLMQHGRER